jgi:hypothetical protein
MNKHIFGFALFGFIVGIAVAASNLLFIELPNPQEVFESKSPEPRTFCNLRAKKTIWENSASNVKIEQAVFDLETKQLKTFLTFRPQHKTHERVVFALHFFVKDGKTSRYLATEQVSLNSDSDYQRAEVLTSLTELENLNSRDNLYIVPEYASDWSNYKNNPPSFNYSTAVPVLLSKGKGY